MARLLSQPRRLGVSLFLLTLFAACGDDSSEAPQPSRSAAGPSQPARPKGPVHPIFGEQLSIDGEVIPNEEIKRHLVLKLGHTYIGARKLAIFVEKELARRKAAGEDISAFQVDEKEVDSRIAQVEDSLQEGYEEEVSLDDFVADDKQAYREGLKQSELFDRVFLPRNPYKMPPVSVEALSDEGSSVGEMYSTLTEGWDRMQKMEEETGEPVYESPKDIDYLQNLLRPAVVIKLEEVHDVKYGEDGLSKDLVMRVADVDVTVEEIWSKIQRLVTPQEVHRSKQWLVNTRIARNALESQGVWLSDAEFEAAYAEEHAEYENSPFSPEIVAVNFRKFPTLSDYKEYFRISKSYEQMIADEINDETLSERIDRLNLYVSGLIDADIILISAYDFENKKWKENGWADAEQRAVEVTRKLAEGMDWDEALKQYSEFKVKKEPTGLGQALPKPHELETPGRFISVNRNEFLGRLEDNDYQKFLDSSSLGEYIFFRQEMGTIENPRRGKYGYYISKLNSRTLPSKTITLENERHRDLLHQDLLRASLDHWIWELREKSLVRGLDA